MLDHFYIATIYTALVVMFLSSALLFFCRKSGDRSRLILSAIVLFSVFNYLPKLINVLEGNSQVQVMTVPMLTLAIFMILSYMTYPIEVISPGWLNLKHLLLLYSPVGIIYLFYGLTLLCGVHYEPYNSLVDMAPHVHDFDALFRLILCSLMFCPILVILFIPYTRIYSNTSKTWVRVYSILFVIDIASYILVLAVHSTMIAILYFHTTIILTLIRIYMELAYRMVDKKVSKQMILAIDEKEQNILIDEMDPSKSNEEEKKDILYYRLQKYMAQHQTWRDPNVSQRMITHELCTNRTTLAKALHENGIESFSTYINQKRISDFISLMEGRKNISIKEAFFICGYRSRTTALRNFRMITGSIPSEYFGRNSEE